MGSVVATPYPSATFTGAPKIDVEWAPASVPGDAPQWRSMVTQADGVRSFTISRGRQKNLDQFVAGTGSVELEDFSSQYDPDNTASPVYGMLTPNKQIRVTAKDSSGNFYSLFQGLIDNIPKLNEYPVRPTFTIPLTATEKMLARASLPNSMLDMVIANIGQPTHLWALNDAAGESVVIDSGSSPVNGIVRNGGVLGSSAIIPFDGAQTCLSLDGGSQDVVFPGGPWPQSTTAWTVGIWFTATTSGTFDRTVMQIGGTGGLVENDLSIIIGDGVVGSLLVNYDTATTSTTYFDSANMYDTGAVHFVVVTLTSDTKVRIYVDGVLQTTGSALADVAAFGHDGYSLGSYYQGQYNSTIPGGFINHLGSLSKFLIYDGTAITQAQVTDLYNAGLIALAGEDTGTRVGRVLDYVDWPTTQRNIQTGYAILGEFDLPGGFAQDYIQTLADTEQGRNGTDGAGVYQWVSRHDCLTNTRSTSSQATFTDQAGAGLQYARLLFENNEINVFNDVSVTRQAGATQRVTDPSSVRKVLGQSFQKTVLSASDVDAKNLAGWILARRKDPVDRITGLEFEPFGDSTLTATLLGLLIGDRVTVVRRVASGSTNTTDYSIEGIYDTFTQSGGVWSWVRGLRLWQAETQKFWILGTSALGVDTRLA